MNSPVRVARPADPCHAQSGGTGMETYREWEIEFGQTVTTLVTVLDRCQRTCDTNHAPALVADSDQLLAVARDVEEWLAARPCPVLSVDMQLTRLARAYLLHGSSLELVAQDVTTVDWSAIEDQLHVLHQLLARTVTMMQERSLSSE